MEIEKTGIKDLLIIKPSILQDARGYFFEAYNRDGFRDAGLDLSFVQDNQSRSSYGVIRGLHYQLEPRAQTKLVRVLEGRIWDIAVDLRKNSPTFLKWMGVELSADNFLQLLVPRGFAHGFAVLSDIAVVLYKCDEHYAPDLEAGIRYDDPEIAVDWKVSPGDRILSQKDAGMPDHRNAKMNFIY